LWAVNGTRTVRYSSEAHQLEDYAPYFNFTGSIIIIMNKLKETDPDVEAIISRCHYYKMKLSTERILAVLKTIAEECPHKNLTKEERLNVYEMVASLADCTLKNLNIRMLIKAYDFYIHCDGDSGLLADMINTMVRTERDKLMSIIYKLMQKKSMTVKEQIIEFENRTGKSRATYFRKKELINERLGISLEA
jgi:hypothetical protein